MDILDELILTMENQPEIVDVYNFLLELQQRRQSDLRPADKYLGNSWLEQYMHIESEVNEIRLAMNDYALEDTTEKDHIAEELIDLQMSCETMLALLGLNKEDRRNARIKVIDKNRKRGYYTNDKT